MTHNATRRSALRTRGALGRFAGPAELMAAAKRMREAGYTCFDCHSPYPIHGMDRAMGLKRSMLGWVVGLMAIVGGGGGLLLQWWSSSVAYPLVISGKPFFSFQAYVPVTFACAVLLAVIGAVVGMFHFNRLPRLHHAVFYSERFRRFSDDGFLVSIEAEDSRFSEQESLEFLRSIGATETELLAG